MMVFVIKRASLLFVVTLLTAGLTGCSGGGGKSDGPKATSSPDHAKFETTFTSIAPSGSIDLSLEFKNPTGHPVTLRGQLIARDKSGAELPRVRVATAFGTESGRSVVMPGGSIDFVQLRGPGSDQVRNVTFEDVSDSPVDVPIVTKVVNLVSLDANGNPVESDAEAQQVRLENPNPEAAKIRVVLMILRAPQSGVPQEAKLIQDISTVEVKSDGSKTVALSSKIRDILRKQGSDSFVTFRTVFAP